MSSTLLTREQFREGVFARDRNTCVICGKPAKDAHHIMERRLFPDGGYYLDNGASLCGTCHLAAESTDISTDDIRHAAGITDVILPPHLYPDCQYDKWGNIILPDGQRMRGELFDDGSVVRALERHLHEFTTRVKYPRTYHLPWSPGRTDDDRVMPDIEGLLDVPVVMTMKMDGEQTTIYADGYCHARSIDSPSHPTRDWVRRLAAEVGPQLPTQWRICGENLWARHSIHYKNLESYFLVFSVWEGLRCLSWAETREWCALLDLKMVPTLWEGTLTADDEAAIHERYKRHRQHAGDDHEGYVLRVAGDIHHREFRRKVGKYVRANHVHTHGHWMREQVVKNGLRE